MAGRSAGFSTSLVLLVALQLAFLATNSGAARSHPHDLLHFLPGSGVTAQGQPCCYCICPRVWPIQCKCGGLWKGSCPNACTNCVCEALTGECTCLDYIDGDACQADSCPWINRESSEKNSLLMSAEKGDAVY